MLSPVGWLNGLSASGVVLFGLFLGSYGIYESRKYDAKILFYWGIGAICAGFMWLGNFIDLLTILITGHNIDNSFGLYGLLSFVWLAPATLFIIIIYIDLFKLRIKWFLLISFIIIGILWEIILFIDIMNSFNFIYPDTPGEDLIDEQIIYGSLIGVWTPFYIISGFIFWGIGFLIKAIQSEGVVRKKYIYISIGGFIFILGAMLDVSIPPGISRVFIRSAIIISWFLYYLGIREEPLKKEKKKQEKVVKIEGDFFRLSRRPDQITEEEVSLYKEKKICLVCKGKATGFNIFICSSCNTLYCRNCATALSDLENVCWVCDSPIDESKPFKSYEKDKEEPKPENKGEDKLK